MTIDQNFMLNFGAAIWNMGTQYLYIVNYLNMGSVNSASSCEPRSSKDLLIILVELFGYTQPLAFLKEKD